MEEQIGEEAINKFYNNIDNWINSNIISYGLDIVKDDIDSIMRMSRIELEKLTQEECLSHSYVLQQYVGHLNNIYNRELAAKNWANSCIWHMIVDEFSNCDKYSKFDEKYYKALLGSKMARRLHSLKIQCEFRTNSLENEINTVKHMSDILFNMSRRHYNGNFGNKN